MTMPAPMGNSLRALTPPPLYPRRCRRTEPQGVHQLVGFGGLTILLVDEGLNVGNPSANTCWSSFGGIITGRSLSILKLLSF